jgi:hypothetical protein
MSQMTLKLGLFSKPPICAAYRARPWHQTRSWLAPASIHASVFSWCKASSSRGRTLQCFLSGALGLCPINCATTPAGISNQFGLRSWDVSLGQTRRRGGADEVNRLRCLTSLVSAVRFRPSHQLDPQRQMKSRYRIDSMCFSLGSHEATL